MENKIIVPKMTTLEFRTREAINTLRGNIQMAGYDVKVVAVTSARAHEGKSSMAFRLAKSLAALNKRTLYLDCDIRNSKTKKRYHIVEKTVGLSEYLCGRESVQNIIYHTDDGCFDIIFSGAFAPNPSELVSGNLFSELIMKLKEMYDYVVVDTPPVNVVIDAAIIAKHCDSTIIVVESGNTDRRDALHAKEQLEYSGAKILGVVLNKIPRTGGRYGRYGYGRRYGYGKYGYGKYGDGSYGDEEYVKEIQSHRKPEEKQENKKG